MSSRFIPNSFQVPNAVIDELMAELSGAELKLYLFVLRKTKGWNKEADAISVSQFMEACKLSNRKVIDGCKRLVELGLLAQVTGSRGTKVFSVKNYTCEESSLVKKVHSTSEESSLVTSEESSHTKYQVKNTTKNNNPLNPPTGETLGDCVAVLDYLNNRLAELSKAVEQPLPKFQAVPNTLKNIKARLGESSRVECETVVDYLVAKWGRDSKMREYLSPKTIFRASNFADYLPKSTAWAANGKPVCVNGKWVSVAELLRVENTPTVDEVRNGYLKYLSLGRGYFKAWQFATAREKALYWAIITVKNKRPLERDTLFACKQSIEEVMAKIDTLKIPQIGENQ